MRIGKLARQSGVGIETLRYYERKGLIPDPERSETGYRDYSPDMLRRVLFIRRAKELGFTLREIGELLELRSDPEATCEEVRERAESKLLDINRRIHHLQNMQTILSRLICDCQEQASGHDCPILESLEDSP